MFEKEPYDNPPMYSPPYSPPSNGHGFQSPQSDFDPYPPPPASYYIEDKPQHFYKWFSPPGIVKAMEGLVVVLCLGIFACVASTLVWDMQYGYGMGLGGYGYGSGYGYGGSLGYGSGYGSYGSGYYGGSYYNSYPTPYTAKTSMIAMAAINFVTSLGFFVACFSKSSTFRSRKFYLVVLVVSVIMAVLQGIINIVYIVGVNPMAQSYQNMLYNPMLAMCQNLYGSSVTGMGGGFPMYNQYLYHYCYVDPQEAVAMVCGFLVVIALAVAAFYSQRTRGKIWRYGKPNIYWEKPLTTGPQGRNVEDWVNDVEDGETQDGASVVFSEKSPPLLNKANSINFTPPKPEYLLSGETYNSASSTSRHTEPLSQSLVTNSSPSEDAAGFLKPSSGKNKRRRRNPDLDHSQYETEYTTGGETANELDLEQLQSMYPEITSDMQRQEYKREFTSDLKMYKLLCAEMDDINDQMNKLSRELDTLEEGTAKYQAVAEEYNRLKDVKQMPDYKSKKLQCRKLRNKLFHIKRMVKNYDDGKS
ncbi:occludin [Chanos chanos]|uniref:Occludin n=1 Tax=Chanos chanos TaxID=29144 RepID=A0A6J2WUD0_CHACN|nr:occludin-like [Chanos chanos]